MKKFRYIFTEGDHKWACISGDPEREPYLIDTNEYVLIKGDEILILDPGGMEVFPAVFSSITSELDPRKIRYIFASHQDPDIISSLALWLEVNPNMKVFTSYLWATFLPHYGGTGDIFISLADDGGSCFDFNGLPIQFIPAHYLHSSGNFHLYDETAKVLFSGDIGAALLPPQSVSNSIFVKDFDDHIQYAKGFHQRWMPSNEAKLKWCERVSNLEIDFLCPQHGLIYSGDDVGRFIDWFAKLPVGVTKD
jgi:flavorubredoxin